MNMKSESRGSLHEIEAMESDDKHSGVRRFVVVVLALWFALVFVLGARGAFVEGANTPPLPIFFGFAVPLVAFFAAYFGWDEFRAFVLSADLRFVAAMQAWGWAGLGFLTLYAKGILPGLFAFPAGFGDMAVGVTAPWIVLGLIRQPLFAATRRFVVWNI